MNARARRARAIIREERRRRRAERQIKQVRAYLAARRRRSIEAQRAAGLYPFPSKQSAAHRIAALFQHYSVGDGIAYLPHDFPPPAATDLQPVPTGLLPINAAYWIGEDVDLGDAPRDPAELQERITAGDVDQEDEDQ